MEGYLFLFIPCLLLGFHVDVTHSSLKLHSIVEAVVLGLSKCGCLHISEKAGLNHYASLKPTQPSAEGKILKTDSSRNTGLVQN